MLKVENKSTKRIRVILIILFLLAVLLTTQPFIRGYVLKDSAGKVVSMLESDSGTENIEIVRSEKTIETEDGNKVKAEVITTADGKYTIERQYFSALKMVSFIGANNEGKYISSIGTVALAYLAFLILPVLALGFQIFDRSRNLKNIVGVISSALAVILIIYFVGPQYLGSGSMLSMLLYLLTAFLSVMGMFARYVKSPDKTVPAKEEPSKQ